MIFQEKLRTISNYFGNILALWSGIFLILGGCIVCDDCEPNDDEPFINIEFYRKATVSPIAIGILEYSGLPGSEIPYFQDTTSAFVFPLPMSSDSSLIVINYVASDDLDNILTDSIYFRYDRTLETTPRNIVKMRSLNTQITAHSFDSLVLICGDTLGICLSNESTIEAYF